MARLSAALRLDRVGAARSARRVARAASVQEPSLTLPQPSPGVST
jgi:hypothetical protein